MNPDAKIPPISENQVQKYIEKYIMILLFQESKDVLK